MAPLNTTSLPDNTDVRDLAARELREAATQSATIGEYRREIHERIDALAETRNELRRTLETARTTIDDAADGADDLRIDGALAGTSTLGYAGVGQGRGSVRFNPDMLAGAADENGAAQMANVIAHELSHAEEQKPMGDILVGDEKVTGWQLLEMKSEQAGAEAEGKSIDTHREGQPEDYAKAQNQHRAFTMAGVQTAELHAHIENGDTVGLQAAILRNRAEQNRLTPKEVERGLHENGDTYRKALFQAMTA